MPTRSCMPMWSMNPPTPTTPAPNTVAQPPPSVPVPAAARAQTAPATLQSVFARPIANLDAAGPLLWWAEAATADPSIAAELRGLLSHHASSIDPAVLALVNEVMALPAHVDTGLDLGRAFHGVFLADVDGVLDVRDMSPLREHAKMAARVFPARVALEAPLRYALTDGARRMLLALADWAPQALPEPTIGDRFPQVQYRPVAVPTPPDFRHIDQGPLGDCHLIAACIAQARARPAPFATLVRQEHDKIIVRLNDKGRADDVVLNQTLPHFGDVLAFSGSPYIAFIEKAAAARAGGFLAIEGQNAGATLERITGRRVTEVALEMTPPSPAALRQQLLAAAQAGCAMTAGTPMRGDHLTPHRKLQLEHAYALYADDTGQFYAHDRAGAVSLSVEELLVEFANIYIS